MPSETALALDAFFEPRSVAVIGATEAPGSIGLTLLTNLTATPFGGCRRKPRRSQTRCMARFSGRISAETTRTFLALAISTRWRSSSAPSPRPWNASLTRIANSDSGAAAGSPYDRQIYFLGDIRDAGIRFDAEHGGALGVHGIDSSRCFGVIT